MRKERWWRAGWMGPGTGMLVSWVLLAMAPLGLAGCSDSPAGDASLSSAVLSPITRPSPPPEASSPAGAIRRLEWCYNSRGLQQHRRLFSSDFRFACTALDTNGSSFRDSVWTREDELVYFEHLMWGFGPDLPGMLSVSLSFDRNLQFGDDPRPGHDPRWHRRVRTAVTLNLVTLDGEALQVSGFASFFTVRGDSAAIPPDLLAAGTVPDSARWYIDRWEDETAILGSGGSGFRDQPTQSMSWCRLKARYRPTLPGGPG